MTINIIRFCSCGPKVFCQSEDGYRNHMDNKHYDLEDEAFIPQEYVKAILTRVNQQK